MAGPLPPFAAPPAFNTQLNPLNELMFRQWVQQHNVPFNPNAQQNDYDMRGFWQSMQQGSPMAQQAVSPNDNRMHYSDYWKTPLHPTFSNESQWSNAATPGWANDSQLATPGGRVMFDETPTRSSGGILGGLFGFGKQGS